jgi:hypothetical protein
MYYAIISEDVDNSLPLRSIPLTPEMQAFRAAS